MANWCSSLVCLSHSD